MSSTISPVQFFARAAAALAFMGFTMTAWADNGRVGYAREIERITPDGDLSDCSPEDRAFFKFDPADVRHAGARGMLVYSNGAVVPVEGPALVVSFVNLVFF